MHDMEKVISGFETIRFNLRQMGHGLLADFCDDAIALLKDQDPVEPRCTVNNNGFHYDYCGACNTLLPVLKGSKKASFCPSCGKAVKWDG